MRTRRAWTADEDLAIQTLYPGMKAEDFVRLHLPDRTVGAVHQRAHRIGAPRHKAAYYSPEKLWTAKELQHLRDHYETMPAREIRRQFLPHRSMGTIWKRAEILGLHQPNGNHRTHGEAESTDDIFRFCSEPDKAYIAGIIDGEGCLGYYWKRIGTSRVHRSTVTITNCDNSLMDWLRTKFGHIRAIFQTKKETGRMTYVCYHWDITGNQRVRNFLRGILPYLIVKREQAELLLGPYPETVEQRAELALKMRLAKTSGLTKIP